MDNAGKGRLLLVEGTDDEHVITKLLARHGLEKSFEIQEKGGFEELHASIYNEVQASGRRILGIVADANDQPVNRWKSISDKLKEANCEVPSDPGVDGSVFPGPREIRVGVWLMPDNQRPGELEDLVADMIPEEDGPWPRAQDYIDQIPEQERKFKPRKVTRAYVHAWLAAQERPRPMGSAITARDLVHDAPPAQSMVHWLRVLFDL